MSEGTYFKPVLGDATTSPEKITKLIFCSGKHYYALDKQRNSGGIKNTAILRIEVGIIVPVFYDLFVCITRIPAKEIPVLKFGSFKNQQFKIHCTIGKCASRFVQ